MKLTIHLQIAQRSRKYGSIHPLPHTPLQHNAQFVKHRANFTLYIHMEKLKSVGPQTDFCTGIMGFDAHHNSPVFFCDVNTLND
jgi:hypothetical protein